MIYPRLRGSQRLFPVFVDRSAWRLLFFSFSIFICRENIGVCVSGVWVLESIVCLYLPPIIFISVQIPDIVWEVRRQKERKENKPNKKEIYEVGHLNRRKGEQQNPANNVSKRGSFPSDVNNGGQGVVLRSCKCKVAPEGGDDLASKTGGYKGAVACPGPAADALLAYNPAVPPARPLEAHW